MAGYIPRRLTCLQAVTHPSSNRARCRLTTLIEADALTAGALNLQDLKMTDQIAGLENAGPGKLRTKSQGWKMQDLENDGSNHKAGKCKTWKMKDPT